MGNGDRVTNREIKLIIEALRDRVEDALARLTKTDEDHERRLRSLEAERVEDHEPRLRAVETGVEKLRERLGLWAAVQATLTAIGSVAASVVGFIRGGGN